ncbi:MAG: hypothetical protein M3308_01570, partial [Actinomycetota bacterium]|nr:hypothetical protein [Actinomycetota bacterium]
MTLAHSDEQRQLLYRVSREGTRFLEREAAQLGYRPRDLFALDEWLETGFFRPRSGRFLFAYPTDLIETLADARATRAVGTPIEVVRAEYRNPLEVILGGSGFLLLGAIYVVRII